MKHGELDPTIPCLVCGIAPTIHPTSLCPVCCVGSVRGAGVLVFPGMAKALQTKRKRNKKPPHYHPRNKRTENR